MGPGSGSGPGPLMVDLGIHLTGILLLGVVGLRLTDEDSQTHTRLRSNENPYSAPIEITRTPIACRSARNYPGRAVPTSRPDREIVSNVCKSRVEECAAAEITLVSLREM